MEIEKSYSDYYVRKKRFKRFAEQANLELITDLIARYKISDKKYTHLKNTFLAYLQKATGDVALSEKNFVNYVTFNCENITPNGAIVPKREYEHNYNCVLGAYYDIIRDIFSDIALFGRLHFPVNFRLKSGTPDPRNVDRGLNTAIPHSDAWVGEDSGGFNFFLPVLGDISKNRLRYFDIKNPENFEESWLSPVASYRDHQDIIDNYRPNELVVPELGYVYVSDFAIIHETWIENGAGNRLSCDTGIYISEDLAGTIRHHDRDDEYLNFIPRLLQEHYVECFQSVNDPIASKETHFSHYTKKLIQLVEYDSPK